jgi:hypothetical protein
MKKALSLCFKKERVFFYSGWYHCLKVGEPETAMLILNQVIVVTGSALCAK